MNYNNWHFIIVLCVNMYLQLLVLTAGLRNGLEQPIINAKAIRVLLNPPSSAMDENTFHNNIEVALLLIMLVNIVLSKYTMVNSIVSLVATARDKYWSGLSTRCFFIATPMLNEHTRVIIRFKFIALTISLTFNIRIPTQNDNANMEAVNT